MQYKIVLTDEEEAVVEKYMKERKIIHKAEACRELLVLGTTNEFDQEQIDILTSVIRSELDDALNGHNNRLKSILYKGGIFASTTAFFLVGLLRDMISGEKKQNVELLYENASKYAVKELKKKN